MMRLRCAGKIHPLMAVAAASIIVVSLVGVAAITGLLPTSGSTPKTSAEQAAATALTTDKPPELAQHAKKHHATANHEGGSSAGNSASNEHENTSKPTQIASAAPVCESCGKVTAVRTVEHAAKPSGVGVVAGALLGGVLGNQVGGGGGKTLATVAGAAAGGFAGNEVEKRTRKTSTYEVDVMMEDGASRTYPFEALPGWKAGDKVRVINGTLETR
jgi:outer membrane lipoprotein SlyB